MTDDLSDTITKRLQELLLGAKARSFGEQLFVKGYRDSSAGKTLLKSYMELGGLSNLTEAEITYFVTGFSIGNETVVSSLEASVLSVGGKA